MQVEWRIECERGEFLLRGAWFELRAELTPPTPAGGYLINAGRRLRAVELRVQHAAAPPEWFEFAARCGESPVRLYCDIHRGATPTTTCLLGCILSSDFAQFGGELEAEMLEPAVNEER
ncbi:MAG: hypothetical protein HUU35_16455 [Armatimonadetes bacterium]|nr:hypothetical protein [Armatimonadota bacterium]